MGRNLSYQDKRTILIVVGSLLLVLCLLMLPRFCTSHQRKPLPIPPDPPIPVQDSNPQTKSPADTLQITDSVFYTSQNTDNGSTNNRIVTKNDNLNGSDNDDTYWNDNFGDDGDVIDVGEVVGPIDTLMSEEQYGNDPIQDDNQSNGINEVATEKGNLSNTNSKSNSDSDENSPNNFDDDDDYYNDTRNEDDSDHNNVSTQSRYPSPHERGGSQNMGIVALIILIVLLICYIIARIKSKNGTLVITANTIDKILIILSPILFFIVWCIGFDHEMFPVQTMLLILSGIMLVISIIFSIIANSGNLFNIIISIMAKLFIFVFTNILLLLLIVIFFISIMRTILNHNNSEETYIVKYDHFLDQWVGYRVN